ncbi:MAG: hypothetical protein ABIH23_35755, partial [bacterium]
MSDAESQAPEPGIYPSVSMDEYIAWPCMNTSTIVAAFVNGDRDAMSMRHLKAEIDGRGKGLSDAMRFGTAVHMRLLEPDEYTATYVVGQPCQGIIGSGKRKGEMCGAIGNEMHTTPDGSWYCYQHV